MSQISDVAPTFYFMSKPGNLLPSYVTFYIFIK